jgi:hypothetical protein
VDVSTWYEMKGFVASVSVNKEVSPIQRENCFDLLSMGKIYHHRVGELGPQTRILIHDGFNLSGL